MMKKMSVSGKIHYSLYGKSDEPNAKENVNSKFFQMGYQLSINNAKPTLQLITEEWHKLGAIIAIEDFRELKRGMWAAKMQETTGKLRNKK